MKLHITLMALVSTFCAVAFAQGADQSAYTGSAETIGSYCVDHPQDSLCKNSLAVKKQHSRKSGAIRAQRGSSKNDRYSGIDESAATGSGMTEGLRTAE